MKALLLAASLALGVPAVCLAQVDKLEWSRNQQTGKVEFQGMLPWPSTSKTQAQQRQLVEHWYFTKLSDRTRAEARQYATANKQLLTFGGLPQQFVYRHRASPVAIYCLVGNAQLTPTTSGLKYYLTELEFIAAVEDAGGSISVESFLEKLPEMDEEGVAALALFHKHLVAALASWQ